MLNLKSTFPMLLHTVSGTTASTNTSSSSSVAAEASTAAAGSTTDNSSSSSSMFSRPQQLLTVGTRNWGNWWDGRGLLRVKIYDFAIYVDGEQVRRVCCNESTRCLQIVNSTVASTYAAVICVCLVLMQVGQQLWNVLPCA
jgi:hypothetical protein